MSKAQTNSNSGTKGNSGNTNGGTETSFTNTPQAKDDTFGTPQSGQLNYANNTYLLNVMANDLGGNSKSLWSVDNGINNSGAMNGYVAGDLLTQDHAGITGLAANRSLFGASLTVTSDGRVAYDASTISGQTAADLTGLKLGDIMTDSFIYAIRMASGTLSWAKANVVLTGVNDVPTVTGVSLAAIEDNGAVTGSFAGDDVDSDDDISTLIYTIVGAPNTGTLVNNGNGTFTFDPGAAFQSLAKGEQAHFNLSYTATDRHGAVSAPASLTITVTGTNDAPTLAAGIGAATEDGPSVSVDLSALGADVDSDNDGSSLIYSISSAPAEGNASISGTSLSFNVGSAFQDLAVGQTRQITVGVTATDAHGASATNNVVITVTGTNDAPTLAAGALGATEDGAAVTLSLAALGADVDSDDDGSTLTYTLLNTQAADSKNVTPAAGAASISGTTLTFDPGSDFQSLAAGQTSSFDLKVRATDAHGATADNTVTVTVTGVNDAPTLAADVLAASEDGSSVSLDLSALGADVDSDDDGSTLTYALLNTQDADSKNVTPAAGAASISGTTLTFDPGSDFQSLASGQTTSFDLKVRATDAHGATADNTVTVTVTGVNDAPQIQSGSDGSGAVTGKTQLAPFTVQQYLGYRSQSLADLQNYAANNAASYTVTTNIIDYTDDPGGFAGEIPGSTPWPAAAATGATGTSHPTNNNFFVRITGQINVTVADTYTFRTFNDDGVFLRVNNTLVINDPGIHAEEVRTGTIALTPGVYPIELFFFEYTGEASLEFSYKSSSGSYELVDLDSMLRDSGVVLFSDVDLNDSHTVSVTSAAATLGELTATMTSDTTGTGTGGQVQWNYAVDNDAVRYLGAGDTKVETFTVTVSDGKGGVAQQQVDVTVTGINDVAELGNAVVSLTETNAQLFASGALSIADVDAGEAFFTTQTKTAGTYGSFSIDATGNWNFASFGALNQLAAGQLVTDVFNVTSLDGTATTVTVNITGTADGPTAVDDSNSLMASAASANTDNTVYWVDWTSASFVSAASGRNGVYNVQGTITLPTKTINVTYNGQIDSVQLSGGIDYYVSKTNGVITNTEGVGVYTSADVLNGPTNNDLIRLNHADSARTLTFSEPVENLFFAIVSMNKNGYLFDQDFRVVSSADSVTDQGYFGHADSYSKFAVGDGRYGIATPQTGANEFHGVLAIDNALSSLTWTGQSDEYWNGFTIGTYGVAQSATVAGNVLSNDDKGAVTQAIVVSAVGGTNMAGNSVTLTLGSGAILKVNKDGSYLYDDAGKFGYLGAGKNHTDSVVYTVKDDQGNTDTATLTITVNGINDAPVAVKDSAITNEDTAVTINVLANDTDVDNGDAKFLVSATNGQKGTVMMSGNNLIYTPHANLNGSDSFSYTMRDAAGLTSTATVSVTINPVADTYVIANVVKNGSFENGLTNWTSLLGGVDVVGDWQAADGSKVIDLNAFKRGGVSQELNTTPGQTYTIGFQLSQNPGADSSTVQVAAGAVTQNFTFNQDSTNADMKWEHKTLSFVAGSNSSVLSFTSLTPSTPLGFPDDAEGPAIDEVVVLEHRVINNFQKGANNGDVLNLSGLLSSINAPNNSTAFSNGFLRFVQTGADTLVQIDADGGGNDYMTAVTLIGVNLTSADSGNYLL
ncbi:MAG: VCBS domain-containing protein [Pseudohongiella sp.]|nr:VCBS domain-containing protein [Pseudohongiella sp.]